jgi:hypothetical protein
VSAVEKLLAWVTILMSVAVFLLAKISSNLETIIKVLEVKP